ncbi:hypothetical protein Tco_1320579 [Tanacetum coccineum]
MSTSTHPIIILSDSDIEDAFSSTNTPDYIPASPDYSPASPGNTSSDPSEDSSKDRSASLTISPFYDDSYIKVMQAYNATSNESPIRQPQAPITPPPVLPLSPVLPPSLLFEPPRFLSSRGDCIYVCRGCLSYILYCDDSYLYVSGITMVLLPFGFLEPLYPGIMDMINNQDIEHMIPPTPPRDTKPPVGSPISLSPSSSVGSSSPVRSTTPPPDYPFDESIFAELDNSLWIIPRPLKSEPVPEKPNKTDAC